MSNGAALIIGVGDRNGIGGALAVKVAKEGLHVFMVGRTEGKLDPIIAEIERGNGLATGIVADATQADDIERVFKELSNAGKPLQLVVYNAGRNIPSPFLKSDIEMLDNNWKRCVLGGFLTGQAALRQMLKQDGSTGHRGTILFTGASASLRGKPMFAGFSAAKAGLRAMAQSMAREFGPQGVHVGHVVIDGIVDGAIAQKLDAGIGKLILNRKGQDGALKPDEVAKSFWMLHTQAPSAWCHELDLRPFTESF